MKLISTICQQTGLFRLPEDPIMPNISIADIRFLLSRVRGDFLPEEQGGLAPFGPTGIRDVQGVANNDVDVTRPGFWFGAADTLFRV